MTTRSRPNAADRAVPITVSMPSQWLDAMRDEAEEIYGDHRKYGEVLRVAVKQKLRALGRLAVDDAQLSLPVRLTCPPIGGAR